MNATTSLVSDKTKAIRQLNDTLRRAFIGGKVMLTQGVTLLNIEDRAAVLTKVWEFKEFSPDNDPMGNMTSARLTTEGNGSSGKSTTTHPTWSMARKTQPTLPRRCGC